MGRRPEGETCCGSLAQETNRVDSPSSASPAPLFRRGTPACPIFRDELIHDLPAGETTPGSHVLALQASAPILKRHGEH